jgi:uncharacterized lipoprotein YddW (UPF0748 family)
MYQLRQLNFNTVYPVIWNRGNTFYPSAVVKREVGQSQATLQTILMLGRDMLAQIVQQGNRKGLRVIPWFEYGFMTPANSQLAKRHPDWLTLRQNGNKLLKDDLHQQDDRNAKIKRQFLRNKAVIKQVWLNPLHPQVQQFILDLLVEVVTKYDIAGIQLDDHFGLPVEFGYDRFTIKLYQQEHQGKKPPNNYLEPEWMQWRANKITDFMQQVFQAVKSVKPNCLVSLSPNPHNFAYSAYLQDWLAWVERGLVEELICQVYRNDLKAFQAELAQPALQIARRRIPVSIGILTGSWRQPIGIAQIQQQVQTVRSQGFAGVSFFYWETLWGYITSESPQSRRNALQSVFKRGALKRAGGRGAPGAGGLFALPLATSSTSNFLFPFPNYHLPISNYQK